MSAKLSIHIDCSGQPFNDHRGKFSPEPELVAILMGFCTGALTSGLDTFHGRNIPLLDTMGRAVGQARLTNA